MAAEGQQEASRLFHKAGRQQYTKVGARCALIPSDMETSGMRVVFCRQVG